MEFMKLMKLMKLMELPLRNYPLFDTLDVLLVVELPLLNHPKAHGHADWPA